MKKLNCLALSLSILCTAGVSTDSFCVTTGLAIYKPKSNVTIAVISDRHIEERISQAQGMSQTLQIKKVVDFTKKQDAATLFLTETSSSLVDDCRRLIIPRVLATGTVPSSALLYPTLDSMLQGKQQKNLKYLWYDNRPAPFSRLTSSHFTPKFVDQIYGLAHEVRSEANIPANLNEYLSAYIETTYQKEKNAQLFTSSRCLQLGINANLICKVAEAMNTDEEVLIIAQGGTWHAIALNEALATMKLVPVVHLGVVLERDYHIIDVQPEQTPIIQNFGDIVIDFVKQEKAYKGQHLPKCRFPFYE